MPTDLEGTLLAHTEHLIPGRDEADILTELLLKLGLDLCVCRPSVRLLLGRWSIQLARAP